MAGKEININQAVKTFSDLRSIPGHFGGGESNPEVDSYGKSKHLALDEILKHFGNPGQDAKDILQKVGKPDRKETHIVEVARDEAIKDSGKAGTKIGGQILPIAPGPVIGSGGVDTQSTDAPPIYFVYEWRGRHDYIYFKINSVTEKVESSGWYNALD